LPRTELTGGCHGLTRAGLTGSCEAALGDLAGVAVGIKARWRLVLPVELRGGAGGHGADRWVRSAEQEVWRRRLGSGLRGFVA